MSLADLVAVAIECDFKAPRLTGREAQYAAHARWLKKPGVREHLRRYKRGWDARQKERK